MSSGPRHRRNPDWNATTPPAYFHPSDSSPQFSADVKVISNASLTPSASGNNINELDMSMSFRDRTGEFHSAVDSLRGRSGSALVARRAAANGALGAGGAGGGTALQQRTRFAQAARQIGHDLTNTCTKLEKLSMLAKRQSLFDDRGGEIQQLTYIIKQDLAALNKQIGMLQEVARSHGSASRQRSSHSNAVVVSLQSKLASASNDFKTVLEVRTDSLKKQAARREHFTTSNGATGGAMGERASSILLQDDLVAQQRYAASNGAAAQDVSIDMDGGDAGATGEAAPSARYQQQLMLIDEQDKFFQQRADTMKNIEQTIVELGDIFHQLAYMVKEQEEMVARIDSNVEDTVMNVDMAHGELLKYFKSISSNRWLMIKVFGVLIIFFVIFVVFVA